MCSQFLVQACLRNSRIYIWFVVAKLSDEPRNNLKYKIVDTNNNKKMKKIGIGFLLIAVFSCSISKRIERGNVIPLNFYEKIDYTTAKGLLLIPCEFEGVTKNYLFDTGAQITSIQRTSLRGKKIKVRGASNRSIENGTETLKSFKINNINFRNTFATNEDMQGLKEQIPNFGGILGRTIIDRANWLINIPNKVLEISNSELSDDSFTDIILDESNGAPYTTIRVDEVEYKAILDLGSIAMLNVPKNTELAVELMNKYNFKSQTRERYTVGGLQSITEQVCTIPSIQFGELVIENVDVTINESSQIRVGMNLFKNNIVYIDNLNKKYRIK